MMKKLNSSGEAQTESRKISSRGARGKASEREREREGGVKKAEVARAWERDADAEESKIKYCVKRKKVVSAFQRKNKKKEKEKKKEKKKKKKEREKKRENIKCPVDRDHLTKRRETSFEILLSAFFVW